MITISPEQGIDRELSVPDLMDTETQLLFDLLHHYESNCCGAAPTEGSVFMSSYSSGVSMQDLRALPEIGHTFVPGGRCIRGPEDRIFVNKLEVVIKNAALAVHAVRRGFANPAEGRQRKNLGFREARSIGPPPEGKRSLEAGLGYMLYRGSDIFRPSIRDSYRVVLRLDEEHETIPLLRRYESVNGRERLAVQAEIHEAEVVKDFFELYRKAIWGTVSEPA